MALKIAVYVRFRGLNTKKTGFGTEFFHQVWVPKPRLKKIGTATGKIEKVSVAAV